MTRAESCRAVFYHKETTTTQRARRLSINLCADIERVARLKKIGLSSCAAERATAI